MNEVIPGGSFLVARKIYRSKIWLKHPFYLKVWLWIFGQASHTDHVKDGYGYKRGELVTTYDEIIKGVAYYFNRQHIVPTLKQVRLILQWLEKEGMITIEPIRSNELTERPTRADIRAHHTMSTRAYLGIRIIVINYNTYQDSENYKGRPQEGNKDIPSVQLGHDNNNGTRMGKEIYSQNSNEFRLSELLLNLILERQNSFKKPDLQQWVKHIDLMIRIDEREPKEIEDVIKWCQADDFWQTNILSTAKLRKQFDQLLQKMGKKKPKKRWDHAHG